jgi:hypothetical protein
VFSVILEAAKYKYFHHRALYIDIFIFTILNINNV